MVLRDKNFLTEILMKNEFSHEALKIEKAYFERLNLLFFKAGIR